MKGLLVFGQTGQVASELRALAPEAVFLDRASADLGDPAACAAALRAQDCRAVINAAAYTAVDRAETEAGLARTINAAAPGALALAAAEKGVPFIQISTDYVFDGSGVTPWREGNPTGPLGVYGATKLEGEQAVAASGGQWAILRTSWVFSTHGANFVKTMLRLGAERDSLNVVDDQHGAPTPARDIAMACLTMAERMIGAPDTGGIYHFAGQPDTTWAGFAREIMRQAGLGCQINPIPSADYPTPARRPLNSRLDCAKIARDFGVSRPDWRAGLAEVIRELA